MFYCIAQESSFYPSQGSHTHRRGVQRCIQGPLSRQPKKKKPPQTPQTTVLLSPTLRTTVPRLPILPISWCERPTRQIMRRWRRKKYLSTRLIWASRGQRQSKEEDQAKGIEDQMVSRPLNPDPNWSWTCFLLYLAFGVLSLDVLVAQPPHLQLRSSINFFVAKPACSDVCSGRMDG